jgi:hypothetical protein
MDISAALDNWEALNKALKCADELECTLLLSVEQTKAARPTYLLRIHSKFNKLRAVRERRELLALGVAR